MALDLSYDPNWKPDGEPDLSYDPNWKPPKQNTGIVGDIGTALKRGVLQMPGMATGLADIAAAPVSIVTGVNRPVSRAADWIGEQTGFQPGKWAEAAGAEYSPEMQQAQQNVEQAKGFFPTLGAVAQNPRMILPVVGESLPATIAGGLVARGAMGAVAGAEKLAALRTAAGSADAAVANAARRALLKSGAIAAGVGEGAVTAGQQMAQTGYDVDPALAAGAAIGAGVGTGIIGGLSGRVAGSAIGRKLGLSDIETSMAAGTFGENAGKAGAAGYAKRIGAGAIQEGLLEEAPQSYQEQVWQNLAAGKQLTEGAAEAAALGAVAGGVMGGGVNAISGPLSKAVAVAPGAGVPVSDAGIQTQAPVPAAGIASAAQFPQFTAPPQPVTGGAPLEQTPTDMSVPQAIQNAPAAPGSPSPVSAADPLPSAKQAEAAGAPQQRVADLANRFEQAAQGLDDLSQFSQQEVADVRGRRAGIAAGQRTMREAKLEAADARVETARQKETEARRNAILDGVDLQGETNIVRRFEKALAQAGIAQNKATPADRERLARRVAAAEGLAQDYPPIPAAPNELLLPDRKASAASPSGRREQAIAALARQKGVRLKGNALIDANGRKRATLTPREIEAVSGIVQIARGKDANQTEVAIPPAQGPEAAALPASAKPANGIAAALQYPQQVTEGGGPLAQQAADMPLGRFGNSPKKPDISPDISPAIPAKKATRIATSSGIAGALVTPQQPTSGGAPLEQSPVAMPIGEYGKRAAVTPSQTSAKPVAESLQDIAANADNKKLAEMAANKNPNIRAAASAEVVRREQSGGTVGDYYKALRESTPEQQTALRKALKLKPSANIVTIADRLDGLPASERKPIFDSVFRAAPVAPRQTPPDAPQQTLSGAGEQQPAPTYKKATARSASHYRVRLKTPLGNFDVFVEKNKDSLIDDYKRDAKNAFVADSNMANLSGIAQISFDGSPEPVSDVSELATVAKNAKWARIAKVEKAASQPKTKPARPSKKTVPLDVAGSIIGKIWQTAVYNNLKWPAIKARVVTQLVDAGASRTLVLAALDNAMTEFARNANGRLGYPNETTTMRALIGRGVVEQKSEQSATKPDIPVDIKAAEHVDKIDNFQASEPQHIDGKDVEKATPAVIKEAVSEGAQNAGLDLRQAHAILLQQIDAAIASAPSEKDSGVNAYVAFNVNKDTTDSVPNTKAHLVEYRAKMANLGANVPLLKKIDEAIAAAPQIPDAFVVFEVPGDGKFKITNTKERLDLFRKKIASNAAGFRPAPKRQPYKSPLQKKPQSGTASDETIREMLHSGELTAALELSKVVGRPLVFGTPSDQNDPPLVKTHSEPIAIKGFNLSVGRSVRFKKSEKALWSVTELESGAFIASGSTKADAEKAAAEYMAPKTPEELRGMITKMGERGKGASQAELESRWLKWAEEEEYRIDNAEAIQEKADKERAARKKEVTDAWERLTGQKAQQGFLPFSPESNPLSMDNRVISSGYMLAVKNGKGDEFLKYAEGLLDADNQWQKRVIDHIDVIRDLATGDWSYDGLTGSRNMPRGEFEATTDDGRKITASLEVEGGLASGFVREDKVVKAKIGQDASITVKQARAQADKVIVALMKPAKKEAAPAATPAQKQSEQYRYALVNRPASMGAVPKVQFTVEPRPPAGRPHHDLARHGIMVTDRKLTDQEVESFELAVIADEKTESRLADDVAKQFGEYAEQWIEDQKEDPRGFVAAVGQSVGRITGKVRYSIGDIEQFANAVLRRLNEAKRPAEPKPAAKEAINDFGEKLEGARKDYAAQMKDAMSVNVASEPLSKSWPEPDYQKLLDGGADPKTVAIVRAARDQVATKPLKAWKIKGWAPDVITLRATANKLLNGEISRPQAEASFNADGFNETARSIIGRADLYELVGHKMSLKGVSFAQHFYSLYKGQQNVRKWVVEQKAKATVFSNWPRELAVGDTKEEALDAFKEKIASLDLGAGAKRQPQFVIYRKRGEPGAWVGKKIGREYIDLHKAADVAEARKYMAESLPALEAKLAKYKETPLERKADNQPRVGDDHRNGAPVTPEVFADTFGFRGVQFGNYVEQSRRQSDLNEAFDGLMDLAAVLGIPPRALSLNGQLGLAFGARGRGGKNAPAAHFETGRVVINLTKGGGPGSLAHEWWHSLDNYFAKQANKNSTEFVTAGARTDGVREAMRVAFNAVNLATSTKAYQARSAELDKRRSKPYWNTSEERSARAFEGYVIAKLFDQGAANDYLANVVSNEVWDITEDARAELFGEGNAPKTYPYPTVDEMPAVRAAFDEFFKTVETKDGEGGNVALFSFAGQQSATADQFQLDRAKQLLADGANANSVRQQTGWFKNPSDGKWRYEIDDSGASLKAHGFGFGELLDALGKNLTLAEVLDHPALFAAYPSIAGSSVETIDEKSQNNGELVTNKDGGFTIRVNAGLGEAKALSVMLHEIQHGIQNVEGFASGGNIDLMAGYDEPRIKAIETRISSLLGSGKQGKEIAPEIKRLNARIAEIRKEDPYQAYRKLAGEVESRNVQQRQNFPADKRRLSDPLGTQDVAPEDVIVMFNGKDAKDAPAPFNTTRASAMAAVGASPADAAVFDMASEGKSAQEILAFLSKASRRPFNRVLAAALSRIGVASTVSIDPAAGWRNNQGRNGAKFAASYSPKTDTVSLYTPREAERHVLHEFVHSATLKAIARGGPAARQMQAIFDYVQRSGTMSDQYGMGNFSRFPNETDAQFKKRALDEFTAELFTNPQFQVRLKQLQAPSGSKLKSAWDWIVRVIANLLGLKTRAQETALDRALSVGAALLQENAELTMPPVAGTRYHTTWHGSPHKFYTFDLSKIGTGEGAQAYGHGLYVAEEQAVADGYSGVGKALHNIGFSTFDGIPVHKLKWLKDNSPEEFVFRVIEDSKNIDKAERVINRLANADKETALSKKFFDANKGRLGWESMRPDLSDATPNLYKVNLPAEAVARMLDWDRPIGVQSDAVKTMADHPLIVRRYPDYSRKQRLSLDGQTIYSDIKLELHKDSAKPDGYAMDYLAGAPSQASRLLREAGIPGIKYLDQQSRSGEKATYNFVLFDDKLARIIEANGVETGVQPWQPGEWEAAQIGERFSQEQPFSGREVAAAPEDPDIRYSLATNWQQSPVAQQVSKAFDLASRSDKKLSWLNPVQTQYHKAERLAADGRPLFKRVFDLGQRFLNDISRFAVMAENAAPTLFHQIKSVADVRQAAGAAIRGDFGKRRNADIRAIAAPLYEGTLYGGGNPMSGVVWNESQLRQRFGLTDKQITLYQEAREAVKVSMDEMAKSLIARHAKREKVMVDSSLGLSDVADEVSNALNLRATVFKDDAKAAHDEAMQQVKDLRDAGQDKRADADEKLANAKLESAMKEVERIKETAKDVKVIAEKAYKLQEAGYFPLMRFGRHTVTARDADGKVQHFSMHDGIPLVPRSGQIEANKLADALREENPDWTVETGLMNPEKYKLYQGMNVDALQLFADHLDEDTKQTYQEIIRLATNERSALKRMIKREGTPGFDKDVRRTLASFILSNARYTSSSYHLSDMTKAAESAEKDGGDIGGEAVKLVDYITKPQEEAAKIRGFLFFNFLGGSLAAAMVNATQIPMMTFPRLSQYEPAAKLAARLARVAKMAMLDPAKVPGDIGYALRRAEEDGITAPHQIYELTGTASNNIFAGSRGANAIMRAWGAPFALAESFNRRATFLASYEIAKAMTSAQLQSAGATDAYEFAAKMIAETQGIYNRGNRVNIGRGALGATVMTFKQFSIMYMEMLSRMPPKQQAIMVGMLLLAAGAGGLPFAEDAEDIIDTIGQWMGYRTNTKRTIRNALTGAIGQTAADVTMNGLLSRIGVDLHSRLGLHNILPGSALLKPSTTDKSREFQDLLGPAASVVASLGQAMQSIAEGKPDRAAMALAPVAIQNAVKGAKMAATGRAEDMGGKPTIPVSASEAAAKGIGFNPKAVADYGAAKRDILQDERLLDVWRERFTADIVQAVVAQDAEALQKARQAVADWNARHPDGKIAINPVAIRRRVAELRTEGPQRVLKSLTPALRQQARQELYSAQ